MADKNTTIPRTMIDCFTQDALTQIKDTLNGDEVTFPNRGGLGTDVRYLSDFALEQIKSAVGNDGGGGGAKRIVSCWSSDLHGGWSKMTPTENFLDLKHTIGHRAQYAFTSGNESPEVAPNDILLYISVNESNEITITSAEINISTTCDSANSGGTSITPYTEISIVENVGETPYLSMEIQAIP